MAEMFDATPTSEVLAGDGRLAYRVDGPADGPVVVFSNSLGLNLGMWQPQVDVFAERFRVIRYDSRGHGRSMVTPGPYTIDQLGGDLLAVLDAEGVDYAHVCGISLGGLVAQWLAVHHPERVVRAVFANTGARIGTEASWDERIARVQGGGMSAIREMVVNRFLSQPFRAGHPEVEARIAAMLVATDPAGYVAVCEALRVADLRGAVGGIRAPALILAGALDESTPVTLSEELYAAVPGSRLVVIPGSAHLSSVEAADAFNAHVLEFLR
jgi:3-oxoadipate enol-lactonase